jgi:hypothetical protein
MTIHAVGWEADSYNFAVGTTYAISTTPAHYNTSYANHAVGGSSTVTPRLEFGSALGVLSFHAEFTNAGALTPANTGEILRFDSGTGPEFRLVGVGTGTTYADVRFEKTLNGSTWTTVGASFRIHGNQRYKLDLNLTLGSSGVVKAWINGVLVVDFTGTVTTQTNTTTFVRLGQHTSATVCYWSQVVVGSTPLLGATVRSLTPNATGTYAEWTGAYTAIDENNAYTEADFITVNTVNSRHSWNVANTTATLISNGRVEAYCQSMRGVVDTGSTPTNLQFITRTGGTDFFSPNLTYAADSVKRSSVYVRETNPNTTARWTAAEIDAVEGGVKAVT